jgi:hypothetical protein
MSKYGIGDPGKESAGNAAPAQTPALGGRTQGNQRRQRDTHKLQKGR